MGAFGQALFATPPVIGGVQLLPFSAFHAQALMELDSPFLSGERDPTWGETASALIICSSCRADGLGRLANAMRSPAARAVWNVKRIIHGEEDTGNELAYHIRESMVCPVLWEKGNSGGKSSGADWPFYVVSTIAREFNGFDYETLWDMPIGELLCHKVILSEASGSVEIAERDLRFREKRERRKENN